MEDSGVRIVIKLRTLRAIPVGLETKAPHELSEFLGGPTIIHLEGQKGLRPIFISTLLHGDETTGMLVMREFLAKRELAKQKESWPGLIFFIGNVHAAASKRRVLPGGGADFNRIWGKRCCWKILLDCQRRKNWPERFISMQKSIRCVWP